MKNKIVALEIKKDVNLFQDILYNYNGRKRIIKISKTDIKYELKRFCKWIVKELKNIKNILKMYLLYIKNML